MSSGPMTSNMVDPAASSDPEIDTTEMVEMGEKPSEKEQLPDDDVVLRFPDPPPLEHIPRISELVKTRLKATGYGIIAAFPLIRYQIKVAVETDYLTADDLVKTGNSYSGTAPTQSTNFIITSVLSACAIWYADTVGFSIVTNQLKKVFLSKWVLGTTLAYTVGQIVLMSLVHNDIFGPVGSLTRDLPGYALPLLLMYGLFYGLNSLYSQALNYNLKGFIARAIVQTLVLVPMLFIYSTFAIQFYFQNTDLGSRIFIRFIIHPILQEITLIPWRFLTLWVQSNFPEDSFPNTWFELMIPQFIFLFSFIGRFLIAANSDILTSLILAAGLSVADVLIRTSTLHRDRAILKFIFRIRGMDPSESKILSRDSSKLYASWILIDEISELSGIFMAPFMVWAFSFADNESGSRASGVGLFVLTFVSLLMELGGDLLKLAYYASWTPPKWMDPSESSAYKLKNRIDYKDVGILAGKASQSAFKRKLMQISGWLGYRSAHFWNSVEFSVHEAYENRHPWTFTIFSFYIVCMGSYVIIAILYQMFHFVYNPTNGDYFLYLQ